MALLISTTLPYARRGQKTWTLDDRHVLITHADPRLLIAKIRAPHFEATIAVAHAPTSCSPPQVRAEWWTNTRALLRKWPADFLLIDANGKLDQCSIYPELVGDKGWKKQKQDDNGSELRDTAIETDLRILNTLHGSDDDYTWRRWNRETYRIDYILACEEWASHCTGTRVDHGIDHGLKRDDHYPLIAHFRAWYIAAPAHNAGRVKMDNRKMQDPPAVSTYKSHLAQYTHPEWNTDVNDHYRHAQQHIMHGAQNSFRRDRFSAIQPYISRRTMALIRPRRYCQLAIRKWRHADCEAFGNLCRYLPKQISEFRTDGNAWNTDIDMLLLATEMYTSGEIGIVEFARRAAAFVASTDKQVDESLRCDRVHHLDKMASRLSECIDIKDATRTENYSVPR